MASHTFQPPTGTRDFYPADLLRRRYIEKLWRDTSIRHGFEEIDGPTFEHADLYKVKSGEGILNEMFGVFSGKDESQRTAAATGEAPFALRPEFTPTLARMYAAKAASLGKPTKWFWMQNCYRAEKPQRGRLREFGQWNCDVIGDPSHDYEKRGTIRAAEDAEVIDVVVSLLSAAGLTPLDVRCELNDRRCFSHWVSMFGVSAEQVPALLALVDRRGKVSRDEFMREGRERGFPDNVLMPLSSEESYARCSLSPNWIDAHAGSRFVVGQGIGIMVPLARELERLGLVSDDHSKSWCEYKSSVMRGLAYYTGTIFEVHDASEAERAVAGGGRYDNLIELFGGPPTPAVGFGMGDVVLGNLLQDKGLLPEGKQLLDALSRPAASFRPDAFVIAGGQTPADQDAAAAQVRPLVARLRRGTESQAWLSKPAEARKPWDADRYAAESDGAAPLHARHSYKATKNPKKLVEDAVKQHARFIIELVDGQTADIRNLDDHAEAVRLPINKIAAHIAEAKMRTA